MAKLKSVRGAGEIRPLFWWPLLCSLQIRSTQLVKSQGIFYNMGL